MEEFDEVHLLTRDRADYLVDRYSERKAAGKVVNGAEHLTAVLAEDAKG